MTQTVLWWLRRDLRLSDNATLRAARATGAAVVPVFVLDPRLLDSLVLAPARRQFLFDALDDLDTRLRARGSYLVVRRGDPAEVVPALARETGAHAVFHHRDLTPLAQRRDARVARALEAQGTRVTPVFDGYLLAPEDVLSGAGAPYSVFTPFRRRCELIAHVPERLPAPPALATPPGIASADWRALAAPRNPLFPRGGETAGLARARAFVRRRNGLRAYAEARNDLAADATAHVSADLHFGTLSVRALWRVARAAAARFPRSAEAWTGELLWREFYAHVLWHFPHVARGAFRPAYDAVPWDNDPQRFAAWCAGRTGYPLVDAAMRELLATGFMHNRARMVTASFLTKDLLIDWRWGERFFLQHLVDGDVASNNGGWQWAAGTGTDAQPYFRVFNPVAQSRRFDPEGAYLARWLPELAGLPPAARHAPWELPAALRPAGYPAPIVDHAVQRARAIALLRAARG